MKNKINRMADLLRMIRGLPCYLRLGTKERCILMSNGIGDICWFAAYYEAFQNMYAPSRSKLLILENKAELLSLFGIPQRDIIKISGKVRRRLVVYAKEKRFKNIVYGQIGSRDIVIRQAAESIVTNKKLFEKMSALQFYRTGIEMDQLYKYGYFNLLQSSKAKWVQTAPGLEKEAGQWMKENGMDGNYVLAVPYANTRENMPREYWAAVIKHFSDKGIRVYVNAQDDVCQPDERIRSVLPPLKFMPVIGKKASVVISARCGLADLLYLSKAALAVVHYVPDRGSDDFQSAAARAESFEGIEQRNHTGDGRMVKDYRIVNINKTKNLEQAKETAEQIYESFMVRPQTGESGYE